MLPSTLLPLCAAALAALPFTQVLIMAVPPLAEDSLRREAQLIVTGEIAAVYEREVPAANGTDFEFVALVKSVKVDFELFKTGDAPSILYVHFRQTGKRPAGWAGPAGQQSRPNVGEKGTLHLKSAADGRWELLEPNGWKRSP